MKKKPLHIAVAAVAAIASFALSRVLWPDDPTGLQPAASLMPHFIVLAALTSLAFGLGVKILLFGKSVFRRLPNLGRKWQDAAWLSSAWLLASWWPHENLHRVHEPSDFAGLIRIEYGFHVTLLLATVIVLRALYAAVGPEKTPSA